MTRPSSILSLSNPRQQYYDGPAATHRGNELLGEYDCPRTSINAHGGTSARSRMVADVAGDDNGRCGRTRGRRPTVKGVSFFTTGCHGARIFIGDLAETCKRGHARRERVSHFSCSLIIGERTGGGELVCNVLNGEQGGGRPTIPQTCFKATLF